MIFGFPGILDLGERKYCLDQATLTWGCLYPLAWADEYREFTSAASVATDVSISARLTTGGGVDS
jgi:hypothetical protein